MSREPGPLSEVCVVIPTYNEAANIGRLIEALRGLSGGLSIIVVDDGSPDGTGRIAEGLSSRFGPLEVLHRSGKSGRGSAVLAGFEAALQKGARTILEMDADFSHDPRELPDTIAALKRGDVVIRSRYAPGSSIVDWSLSRRVFSRLANLFARALLGIPLSDYTNGYRAYAREALLALEPEKIESSGYIVLSETAYQLHLKGFHFVELPTVFVNRRRGQSNLTLREVLGALGGILRLRWKYRDGKKRKVTESDGK